MALSFPGHLLLVDLDGVLVQEMASADGRLELLRLHRQPAAALARAGTRIVVLTHRSRAEAQHILAAVGVPPGMLAACLAAEDLYRAALRRGRLLDLLRGGLKKSFILPVLAQRFAVRSEQVAFLDDRRKNLADLLGHGLGLALLAPAGQQPDGTLRSFELDRAIDAFLAWAADPAAAPGQLVELPLRTLRPAPWCRTGMDTEQAAQTLFNRTRLAAGRLRRRLVGRSG